MFKGINWKMIFKCFAWAVCLSGIVVLMSFVGIKKHTVTITNIKILIPGADNFIEREEIDAVLKQSQGSLIGRKLEQINLQDIEKKIKSNPYIAKATVYADMDGVIHIEIKQRQPILRVINTGNQDYYIDRNGVKMPVSPNFTANVLVANGNIMEIFTGRVDTLITQMAKDLYKTALFIKQDTLWDAQIEQMFVNDKNDIELIPRVGNQRIVLGTADSLDLKMRNLLAFYKQAMPKVGWDTYKTINIKYTNQVVCEKNKIDSLSGSTPKPARIADTVESNKEVIAALVREQIAMEMKNDGDDDSEKTAVVVAKPANVQHKVNATVKPLATAAKQIHKPTAKPVVKPPGKPVEKTVVKPRIKPMTAKPADVTLKPVNKPAVKKPVTTAAKLVKKTVVKPGTETAKEKNKTDTKKNK